MIEITVSVLAGLPWATSASLDGVLTTDLRDTSPLLQPAAIVRHGFAGEAAAASQRSSPPGGQKEETRRFEPREMK